MLPLGRRVQEKIEKLIDKHMSSLGILIIDATTLSLTGKLIVLGASRLDLSSISSEELWRKSGRLENANSEVSLI
jgi:prolyl-tRNA synthetase